MFEEEEELRAKLEDGLVLVQSESSDMVWGPQDGVKMLVKNGGAMPVPVGNQWPYLL